MVRVLCAIGKFSVIITTLGDCWSGIFWSFISLSRPAFSSTSGNLLCWHSP